MIFALVFRSSARDCRPTPESFSGNLYGLREHGIGAGLSLRRQGIADLLNHPLPQPLSRTRERGVRRGNDVGAGILFVGKGLPTYSEEAKVSAGFRLRLSPRLRDAQPLASPLIAARAPLLRPGRSEWSAKTLSDCKAKWSVPEKNDFPDGHWVGKPGVALAMGGPVAPALARSARGPGLRGSWPAPPWGGDSLPRRTPSAT